MQRRANSPTGVFSKGLPMLRYVAFTCSIVALAACSPRETSQTTTVSSSTTIVVAAPSVSAEPVSAAAKLTVNGYGPLRIGMTRAEVEAALGADANPGAVGGAEPEVCDMFHPARAPEGMLVMIENGILTSVWISQKSTVETDRALNTGDTAAEVTGVYGAAAKAEPHHYSDPPAQYLTVWATQDHETAAARGLRYEIGPDGKVSSIAGGGRSITYSEGCA